MQCRQCNAQLPPGASFCHSCGASDPIAAVQTPKDALLGRTLNKQYRIVRKLGEGGFGAVYEADEPRFERKVAIKTIHQKLLENPIVLERFRREGMAAGKLEHPSAVKVFNLGETEDGLVFLVMEYIEGQTLAAHLEKSGALSPKAMLELLEPIGEVLAEAHQKGIIHRDLKPHNIMLTPKRGGFLPKLLDFGISKVASAGRITQTMVSMGTPAYMAPEQWEEGKKADARTDLYALGLIVYQCLTGAFPFEADTAPGWMKKHCLEPPKNLKDLAPQLPAPFCDAVMKAIEKNPDDRYPDTLSFFQALSSSLSGEAANSPSFPDPNAKTIGQDSSIVRMKPAPPPSVAPSTLPGVSAKKRPFVIFGLSAAAVLLVVGLIYLMAQPTEPPSTKTPTSTKTTAPVSQPAPLPLPIKPRETATWQWLNPTPQGNDLNSIARLSDREIFAVGDAGTVVRSEDGGRSWKLLERVVASDLRYLWALPSGHLYAVGENASAIFSSDRGETWSALKAPVLEGPYVSFWASSPDDLYLLGFRDLFRSTDQGKTWLPLTLPPKLTTNPDYKLRSVWGSGPNDVYVVGDVGMVFHSVDQGVTWESLENLPAANAENGIVEVTGNAGDVFLLRDGASLLETFDQGKTWYPIPWPHQVPIGLYISSSAHLRSADATQIYYSPDKMGWQVAYSEGLAGFNFADFVGSDKSTFVVGENGGIASSLDGVRWELTSKTVSDHFLRSTWGDSSGKVFAVGQQGAILQSIDAGETWTIESAFDPGNDRLEQHWDDIWGGPEGVFAVGSFYIVERTTAGWSGHLIEPRYGLFYSTIWGAQQKLYIGGEHGSLRSSTDKGISWKEERPTNPSEGTIQAMWGASPDEIFAVGDNLLLFSTGDGIWESRAPTVIGSFALYGVGGAGNIRIAVGAELRKVEFMQPPTPPGLPPLPPIPPKIEEAGSFMLRSDDSGETWKRITTIPDANALNAIWAVSQEEFYLVASNGNIFHSKDSGKTWEQEFNAGRSLQELWGTNGVLYTVGDHGGILRKK